MSDKHEWDWCGLCGPMVICGHCGNNCCNGGSGDNCPDKCASAYAKMDANDPTVAELKSLVSKAQKACHDAVMDRSAVWCELDLLGDEKSTAAVSAIRALRTPVEAPRPCMGEVGEYVHPSGECVHCDRLRRWDERNASVEAPSDQ